MYNITIHRENALPTNRQEEKFYMKKTLSAFLAATMLTTPLCAIAEVDNTVTVEYVVSKNFENEELGIAPSLNTVPVHTENKIYVAQENGNKYVRYESNNEGCFTQTSVGGTLDGSFVLNVKLKMMNRGDGVFRVSMFDAENVEAGLFLIDKSMNLCSKFDTPIMALDVGKTYEITVAVNQDAREYDIYVNHRKRAAHCLITKQNFQLVSQMRFHSYMVGTGEKPIIFMDDLYIYTAPKPVFVLENERKTVVEKVADTSVNTYTATDEEVAKYMKGSVSLFAGKNKIATDGEISLLDPDNPEVCASIVNNRTLVPARFVSEALGASVNWDETGGTAVVENKGDIITIKNGSDKMLVNDREIPLDSPASIINGRMMIPLRAVAEAMGKKITYDPSGLIVIADRENYFTMRSDLGIFRKLTGNLVFENPSSSDIVSSVKQRFPNKAHPRVMADSGRFAQIKNNILTDEFAAKGYEAVKAAADKALDADCIKYSTSSPGSGGTTIFNAASGVKYRIGSLGIVYKMTGEAKYAERGIKELLSACDWPDWHPKAFLGTAEMICAAAIGYDWFYDYMTEEQRASVRKALYDKGFMQAMDDFNNLPRVRSYTWTTGKPDNWRVYCDGALITAAIAVCDEEDTAELSEVILDNAMVHIQPAVSLYGPDGAWYEGTSYWNFCTVILAQCFSTLETASGSLYGFMDAPGMKETGYFVTALTGPMGSFNFHDATQEYTASAPMWYFADKLGNNELALIEMNNRINHNLSTTFYDLVWYNPVSDSNTEPNIKRDWLFRDADVVTTRTDWSDSAVFAAIHAGKVNVYHGHMDMGEFIIDGYGTRYAAALGKDSYDAGLWDVYRNRAEGHNTLVVNPDKTGGQLMTGDSKIERFEANENGIIATLDMTSGYKKQLKKAIRGMMTFDNRQRITVQDEIEAFEPADVYWFMHSSCEITVLDDGKTAILGGNGKDMVARLTCTDPDAVFTVMDAKPLETSPANSAQASNSNFKKLTVKLEKAEKETITVEFSFVSYGVDETREKRAVTPISEWKLEEARPAAPVLSSISINGNPIERFLPNNYFYEYRLGDEESIPEITVRGDADTEIIYPQNVPGYIIVRAARKDDKSIYSEYIIKLKTNILTADENGVLNLPENVERVEIKGVSASDVPEIANPPENTIDGDLKTRYAAQGAPTITFDLGEEKTVKYVGIAVYQEKNDKRRQKFKVYTSLDGEKYDLLIKDGETTGTTLNEELFKIPDTRARYVMIKGGGSNISDWNSITEVGIYGLKEGGDDNVKD